MQLGRILWLVPVGVLMVSTSVLAQGPASPLPFPGRGYIVAGAGASLNPRTATTFSAEIAERVHSNVQVYADVTYYYDLMSRRARNEVEEVGQALTELTGAPFEFHARDRGLSFVGGAKYLVPTGTGVRPYIGGGVGVLNLRRSVREIDLGSVTEEFLADFSTGDGIVDITQRSTTRPIGELTLGLGIAVGRGYLDLGYKFTRVFHNVNRSLHFSQVGAAIGFTF